jgi:hypothetical protein
MKTNLTSRGRPLSRALYASVIAIAVLGTLPRNAHAQLYVAQESLGIVSEYDVKTGATINANFITGLNEPPDSW